MSIVTVSTFQYRHEAELAKDILASAGIRSIISADDAGGWRPELLMSKGVRLLVDDEDLADARETLESNIDEAE
jgi:hypothetical protein